MFQIIQIKSISAVPLVEAIMRKSSQSFKVYQLAQIQRNPYYKHGILSVRCLQSRFEGLSLLSSPSSSKIFKTIANVKIFILADWVILIAPMNNNYWAPSPWQLNRDCCPPRLSNWQSLPRCRSQKGPQEVETLPGSKMSSLDVMQWLQRKPSKYSAQRIWSRICPGYLGRAILSSIGMCWTALVLHLL